MTTSLSVLEALVQEGRRRGARGIHVLLEEHDHHVIEPVDWGRPAVERRQEATLTVRGWLEDGRTGIATGRADAAEALMESALAEAASAPPNAWSGPVERYDIPDSRRLDVDDRRYSQLTDEDRLAVVDQNRRAAEAVHADVGAREFRYADCRTRRLFVNSKGVAAETNSTLYDASGRVRMQIQGEEVSLLGAVSSRTYASIACLPYGAAAAKRVVKLVDTAPPVDGPIRVLMPPEITARVIAWLGRLFTADHLEAGDTLLGAPGDRPEFHPLLHVVDDGARAAGVRTRAFDDEGVPPVPVNLIREGVIDGRFLDTTTARSLGLRPTGHLMGGELRPTNLLVKSGVRSINAQLTEQPGPVFWIDDLPDLSGFDPATGDVRARVSGRVLSRHNELGARRGAMLVGNLVEALGAVAAVASNTDRIGNVDAPGMFLDGFAIEG